MPTITRFASSSGLALALGLDPGVIRKITIEAQADQNEPILARVEMLVTIDKMQSLIDKRYLLVEVKDDGG